MNCPGAASAGMVPSIHHSSFILHHLPLFSYAIAALLMATALVAARLWGPAGGLKPTARHSPASAVQVTGDSAPAIVGRITGVKDCRWADPGAAAHDAEAVQRGRRYVLNGGLLEITYNTGAKVVIEGPAVYVADGGNWGTLLLGRLTARVGKKERPGAENGEAARSHGGAAALASGVRRSDPYLDAVGQRRPRGRVRRRGRRARNVVRATYSADWSS